VLDTTIANADAKWSTASSTIPRALPNPDPTNSGTTTYSVWARALGKPDAARLVAQRCMELAA